MSMICGAGCRPDRFETNVVGRVQGSASFQTKRVEKHESTKWWEHEVTIDVTYCKDLSKVPDSAKDPRSFFPYPIRSTNDDLSSVVIGPNQLQIRARMRRTSEDAARMNASMDDALKWFMSVPSHFVDDGSFSISSEQKERVRTYDVLDRVERR